jgi:hypothetical protein
MADPVGRSHVVASSTEGRRDKGLTTAAEEGRLLVLRSLPDVDWPVPFQAVPGRSGPAADLSCPCGSKRRVRSCHGSPSGEWHVAMPPPLLLDDRTGESLAGCFASASRDCSSKLSLEHWISHDVLRSYSVDERLYISGVP